MKHTVSNQYIHIRKQAIDIIPITVGLYQKIRENPEADWVSLFQGFRLDLQNRILGHYGDELIKLQGKLELINELEAFFVGVVKATTPKQVS